jgi:hypothetical protein
MAMSELDLVNTALVELNEAANISVAVLQKLHADFDETGSLALIQLVERFTPPVAVAGSETSVYRYPATRLLERAASGAWSAQWC